MVGIKYVKFDRNWFVVIEIWGVENGDLVVPVNNTLVCCTSFLAADTWPCVLIKRFVYEMGHFGSNRWNILGQWVIRVTSCDPVATLVEMEVIVITGNVFLYMCVASHAFVNNLFGNFPGSSESKSMFYELSGVIVICVPTLAQLVVQMFVMQGMYGCMYRLIKHALYHNIQYNVYTVAYL